MLQNLSGSRSSGAFFYLFEYITNQVNFQKIKINSAIFMPKKLYCLG